MPLTYRRSRGSDTWHFREDCPGWPQADFEQHTRTPSDGVCCVECTYWPTLDVRTVIALHRHDARADRFSRPA